MKRSTLFFLLAFCFAFIKPGKTTRFSESGVKFTLPSKAWSIKDKDVQKDSYTYITYLRDSSGTNGKCTLSPSMTILIENVSESTDILTYSAKKRSRLTVKVDRMLTYRDGISVQNGIAYKGYYTDKNNVEHVQFLLLILNMNKGMEITLDAPGTCGQQLEQEFAALIASFEIYKTGDY
jgi:hypothetical protein